MNYLNGNASYSTTYPIYVTDNVIPTPGSGESVTSDRTCSTNPRLLIAGNNAGAGDSSRKYIHNTHTLHRRVSAFNKVR